MALGFNEQSFYECAFNFTELNKCSWPGTKKPKVTLLTAILACFVSEYKQSKEHLSKRAVMLLSTLLRIAYIVGKFSYVFKDEALLILSFRIFLLFTFCCLWR